MISSASLGIEEFPLTPGETADGQGVLEVLAGKKDDILVDQLEAILVEEGCQSVSDLVRTIQPSTVSLMAAQACALPNSSAH